MSTTKKGSSQHRAVREEMQKNNAETVFEAAH